jgi:hypothetical protein
VDLFIFYLFNMEALLATCRFIFSLSLFYDQSECHALRSENSQSATEPT